jgi:glycolate oxidase
MPNSYGNPAIEKILNELFEIVYKLGGTISAEHGIGLIQKGFMPIVFQEKSLELMRSIKKVFDPNNILNAGKVI